MSIPTLCVVCRRPLAEEEQGRNVCFRCSPPELTDNQEIEKAELECRGILSIRVGEKLFEFLSLAQWTNKAKSWFKNRTPNGSGRGTICIDAKGRVCDSGFDFMRAEKENTYPISVYAINRESDVKE